MANSSIPPHLALQMASMSLAYAKTLPAHIRKHRSYLQTAIEKVCGQGNLAIGPIVNLEQTFTAGRLNGCIELSKLTLKLLGQTRDKWIQDQRSQLEELAKSQGLSFTSLPRWIIRRLRTGGAFWTHWAVVVYASNQSTQQGWVFDPWLRQYPDIIEYPKWLMVTTGMTYAPFPEKGINCASCGEQTVFSKVKKTPTAWPCPSCGSDLSVFLSQPPHNAKAKARRNKVLGQLTRLEAEYKELHVMSLSPKRYWARTDLERNNPHVFEDHKRKYEGRWKVAHDKEYMRDLRQTIRRLRGEFEALGTPVY